MEVTTTDITSQDHGQWIKMILHSKKLISIQVFFEAHFFTKQQLNFSQTQENLQYNITLKEVTSIFFSFVQYLPQHKLDHGNLQLDLHLHLSLSLLKLPQHVLLPRPKIKSSRMRQFKCSNQKRIRLNVNRNHQIFLSEITRKETEKVRTWFPQNMCSYKFVHMRNNHQKLKFLK